MIAEKFEVTVDRQENEEKMQEKKSQNRHGMKFVQHQIQVTY